LSTIEDWNRKHPEAKQQAGTGGGSYVGSNGDATNNVETAATPTQPGGLPSTAREAFRCAEALCEQQKFAEAVPVFRRVLQMLEATNNSSEEAPVPHVVTAEVWAHLGVAMQSLDRVPEAIDCYKRAVVLDPSLHVCFANLATLHAYLHEHERALAYIEKALALDPPNATYLQIRRHLGPTPSTTNTPPVATRGSSEPPRGGGGVAVEASSADAAATVDAEVAK